MSSSSATRIDAEVVTLMGTVQKQGPRGQPLLSSGNLGRVSGTACCDGGISMRALIATLALAVAASSATAVDLSTKEASRVKEAATVLREIHAVPDKDVPQELWEKAECVIVVPGLKKAAFIIGGEYGKGLMSCRHNGEWSAPVFMQIGKGSWGLQIGAQSIDLV